MLEVIPVKRKNPYSLVNVNEVSLEVLTRGRPGHRAVVGVDVAKGELVMCVVWPDREFERPWRVKSPGQLSLAVSTLRELNKSCPVVVAMESSGTYGDAFRQAMDDVGLSVQRVSAKAVKDDSEGFDGVPSNHDGKDAAIIGTLCVNGRSNLWRWNGVGGAGAGKDSAITEATSAKSSSDESFSDESTQTDQAIRYQVRRLDTGQRIKQIFCGKLEAMLARHWPEAGALTNQSGPTMTAALAHWGDPTQYDSAGAYRKAMGLNLTERSSGMYKGKLKLSKRGQRLPRKWLYFSALRWMREPSVKTWLEQKKQRDGGRGGKAATAIMRRLALAAWHAGQGVLFDPKRLFPGKRRLVAS
jgi:transposase